MECTDEDCLLSHVAIIDYLDHLTFQRHGLDGDGNLYPPVKPAICTAIGLIIDETDEYITLQWLEEGPFGHETEPQVSGMTIVKSTIVRERLLAVQED